MLHVLHVRLTELHAPMHINSHTNFQLGFSKFLIFQRSEWSRGRNCITMPNFVEIASTVAEISRFFHIFFNNWNGQEGQTTSVCQISSKSFEPRLRYVSFNIMLVWLENAYSQHFLGFLGGTFTPNNVIHRPNPKKNHPWAEPRHFSHKP